MFDGPDCHEDGPEEDRDEGKEGGGEEEEVCLQHGAEEPGEGEGEGEGGEGVEGGVEVGDDDVGSEDGGEVGEVGLQEPDAVSPGEEEAGEEREEDWRPGGEVGADQQEDGGPGLVDQDQAQEEDDGETDWSGYGSSEGRNNGDDEIDVSECVGYGDDDEKDEDEA